MAIVRTAKGTNASKASGTSLSINNIAIDVGSTIVVGICFEISQGNPTIMFGKKQLKRLITIENATGSFRTQIYAGNIRNGRTRDLVATWDAAILARAMFCTQLTEASIEDVSKDKAEDATTDPDTGVAPTSTVADTISIAAFGANGPDTDSMGTIGSGHTQGQRVGTSGGVDNTNLTLTETYELLATITTIKSQFVGATSRDWANAIIAFKSMHTYTVESAHYEPYDGHPNMEAVVFTIKDGTGEKKFQTKIPREDFEVMTDQEVTDRIHADCMWWAEKTINAAPSPDFTADTAFDTRVAGWVNDQFVI